MISVTKVFEISAAHFLPNYVGLCVFNHGHNWIIEVTVCGDVEPVSGMVLDFKILKDIFKTEIKDHLDHRQLNDVIENPTAENILSWIVKKLEKRFLGHRISLFRLKIWESRDSYAEWVPDKV